MDTFLEFLKSYGVWGLLIVVLAFVFTQLIKIPLKKLSEKKAGENNIDKICYTKWFTFIPYVLCFVGALLNVWGNSGWGGSIAAADFNWTAVITETLACGSIVIAVYNVWENLKKDATEKTLQKYATADDKKADATTALKAANESKKEAEEKKSEAKRLTQIQKTTAKITNLQEVLKKLQK